MAHATVLYSRSLQHLRQDLQVLDRSTSATSMYSNLWSSFLLCLYEIVSGVSSAGWLEHCHGITALIQMLGPHAFQELGANLMLETYRGLIIVNFLVKRKRCFLESSDWKTVPWTIKRKSLGSQLQDLFCDAPGLMEEVDEIMQRSALGHETVTMENNIREKNMARARQETGDPRPFQPFFTSRAWTEPLTLPFLIPFNCFLTPCWILWGPDKGRF
ncbi:hypothetical protein TsFJ059_002496 [Trichoderma semiorbis]|uniref:Uncharacterized protein n=1 Tax=Trichoderma semiorbis TaxID=1491008 RepID=A0A9P8KUZ3_9HYPO|nr:hypothetical protein TsFJ059_002496 [Trichoderma semiorbis]